MSVYSDATYIVNSYDEDGDIIDECVQIHLGATVLVFSNIKQVDVFIERLQKISEEIKKNY